MSPISLYLIKTDVKLLLHCYKTFQMLTFNICTYSIEDRWQFEQYTVCAVHTLSRTDLMYSHSIYSPGYIVLIPFSRSKSGSLFFFFAGYGILGKQWF